MRNNTHSLRTIARGSWKHDLRVVTFGAGPKCHASIKGKHMDKWTELRTALSVARLGTVSAAAEALNIHRATVNRHIDALEDELGTRVFIRHARGYTLTDAGEDVLKDTKKTHDILHISQKRATCFIYELVPELSVLGPNPSQTLSYGLKLTSVQF